jgi:hypothetical protein
LLKKLIPILFLFIFLVSVTELHEFFKLPQLVEHFIEHKSEDNKITLIDFLVMHYSDSNHANSDKSKDMQLPFKSHNKCESITNIGFNSFHTIQISLKSEPIEINFYNIDSIAYLSSAYLSSIWQPPKSC